MSIETYRGPIVLGKVLMNIAFDKACLARAQFADDQKLEEIFTHLGHGSRGEQ